jgi:hypothetical protein
MLQPANKRVFFECGRGYDGMQRDRCSPLVLLRE